MSPALPSPAEPPPLPPLAKPKPPALTDFKDWLSPMIVKELRQGLRTWMFAGAFVTLQVLLVLVLIISGNTSDTETASYLFWSLVGFIILGVIPLRAFGVLADEIKMQTLDTLQLTRLSAWRITLGKWVAIVAQSGLVTISVVPYIILRYFNGGVEVGKELVGLVILWMGSALWTAYLTGFSSQRSFVIRGLMFLAGVWMIFPFCFFLIQFVAESRSFMLGLSPISGLNFLGFIGMSLLWLYAVSFFINLGATAIASTAENHAFRKRLLGVVMFALFLVGSTMRWDLDELCSAGSLIILLLTGFDMLTEQPVVHTAMLRPFKKKGLLGRLSAFFLTPGWTTGMLLYTAMLLALMFVGSFLANDTADAQDSYLFITTASFVAFPLILHRVAFRKVERLMGLFVIVLISCCLYGLFIVIVMEMSRGDGLAWAGLITPISSLFAAMEISWTDRDQYSQAAGLVGAMWILIALVYALFGLRPLREALKTPDAK